MPSDLINNLIRKINRKQFIGLDLISLSTNKELIEIIHKNALIHIRNNLNNYTFEGSKGLVMLSLTIIAFENYDRALWPYIEKTYSNIFMAHGTRVKQIITDILIEYNFTFKNIRSMDSAISYGVVPKLFLKNYMDFLFDLYAINFDYILPDNDEVLHDRLSSMFDYLKDFLDPNTNNFELDGIDSSRKSYKLIQSTKRLISNANFHDALIEYTTYLLKNLEAFYDGHSIDNILLESLLNEMNLIKGIISINKKERQNKINAYSKHPFFYLRDNDLYLKVPHKLFREDEISDPYSLLSFDNNLFSKTRLKAKKVIGRIQIEAFSLKIPSIFKTLNISIVDVSGLLYSYDIEFDPMFFNSDGDRISKLDYQYKNILFLDSQINSTYTYNANDAGYYVHMIFALNSISYIATSKGYNYLSNIIEPHALLGHKYSYAKILASTRQLPIYKFIEFINWKSRNKLNSSDKLFLNGILIKGMDKVNMTLSDGFYHYSLHVILKEDGFYKLEFFERGRKEHELNFLILQEITCNKATKNSFNLTSTSLINGHFSNDYPTEKNLFDLSIGQEIYSLLINTEHPLLSFNSDEWISLLDADVLIWHEDIESELQIRGLTKSTVEVQILDNQGMNLTIFSLKENDLFEFVIEKSIIDNFSSLDFIIVLLEKMSILIYFKSHITNKNDMVHINPKKGVVSIKSEWVGTDDLYLRVSNYSGSMFYNDVLTTSSIDIKNLEPLKQYKIEIYQPERFNVDLLVHEDVFFFYTFNSMVNKRFTVSQGIYDEYLEFGGITSDRIPIRLINSVEILSYNGNNEFTATLIDIFKKSNSPYDFNPVILIATGNVKGNTLWFEVLDSEGDLISLNYNKKYIINNRNVVHSSQSLTEINITLNTEEPND